MISLVQFDDLDALLAQIASDFSLEVFGLLNNTWQELGIEKINLSLWSDLENLIGNDNLFETLENEYADKPNNEIENIRKKLKNKVFVANFENLTLTKESLEYLTEFLKSHQDEQTKIYLHTTKELSLSDKTILKKYKFSINTLKISDNDKLSVARSLNQKLDLKMSEVQITKILGGTTSLQEIINKMDYLGLISDPLKHLDQITIESQTLLFTLSTPPADLSAWKKINEDDLQFALSIVFGKLEKKSAKLAQKVIETDQKIKTRGGIKPVLWWKLLLWQIKNNC